MPRPICAEICAENRCTCFDKVTVASIGLEKYLLKMLSRLPPMWLRKASPTSIFLPFTVRFISYVQVNGPSSCSGVHRRSRPRLTQSGGTIGTDLAQVKASQ